jgi:RND family efflux transporter MFP subunit
MNKASIVLTLVLAGLLVSCRGEQQPAPAQEAAPVRVRTLVAETMDWPAIYEAIGTVRARTAATISSKVMGYVQEVRVQAGDLVRSGQPLVTLDSRDLEAAHRQAEAARNEARSAVAEVDNAIAAAQAQLELAQVTFRRMKDLYDKKSVSEQEFDEASAKVRMAEANHQMALSKRRQLEEKIQQAGEGVKSAEIMRSYAEIRAPFHGVVTEKMVDQGNLAAPGAPLLTIERAGAYRLEARLEESMLAQVRAGQQVEIELEALGKAIPARVSEVVPAVDAASRAFPVKINLPNLPGLRSGLFGRARFRTQARSVLAIPADAVIIRGQVQSVFVVEDGRVRSRLLTLGQRRDNQVEVLTGLTAGEAVVYPAPTGLADGARVEVER